MAWKQKRNYQPGAKLYARRKLKFGSREVTPGEELPELSEKDHRQLWQAGHADHLPQSPYVAEKTIEMPGVAASAMSEQLTRAERRAQRR